MNQPQKTKAIVLAGGSGTRLYPLTLTLSKQLMPVYDKPLIYYPLSTVMLAGIQDILIISTPHDLPLFKKQLGDGSAWGINLSYAPQARPEGIAQALILAESFIGDDNICLILGDNLIYGHNLAMDLEKLAHDIHGATIFAYHVNDPERYGVIAFDNNNQPHDIIEKPQIAPSNYAVTGLYFYNNQAIQIAKSLQPSRRGELEITDVNRHYLQQNQLKVHIFNRGVAWLDTGTHEALLDAARFVQVLENRQGLKVGCPEETAWRKGFIDDAQLLELAKRHSKNNYGKYLQQLLTTEQGR